MHSQKRAEMLATQAPAREPAQCLAILRVGGAGDWTRTSTTKGQGILSPRRLPFRHTRIPARQRERCVQRIARAPTRGNGFEPNL